MYIRNKVGRRTKPWGTPDVTTSVVDSAFLTTTRWFRLVKKSWIQFTMRGLYYTGNWGLQVIATNYWKLQPLPYTATKNAVI